VGGGLNILNGCEGVEVAFLLIAALCAMPGSHRRRLCGMAVGVSLVFMLNQARILALFYAFRYDKVLFSLLHGTVAPLAMIACTVLFVAVWPKSRLWRDGV
jgi:exosortase/archaeosortase family protein